MTPAGPPSFTDPDWLATIIGWAEARLAEAGHTVVGAVEQPHVRPWSTVLRIPTDRGPVWCKAMVPATAHEARLLASFAVWNVPCVLEPLAVDNERAWLLLADGGPTLRQTRPDGEGDRDLPAWEGILAAYADLQRTAKAELPASSPKAFRTDARTSFPRRWIACSTPSGGGSSLALPTGRPPMRHVNDCAGWGHGAQLLLPSWRVRGSDRRSSTRPPRRQRLRRPGRDPVLRLGRRRRRPPVRVDGHDP